MTISMTLIVSFPIMAEGIRFATINTWKGDGAYGQRLAVLAQTLLQQAADVVLCQEVLSSSEADLDTAAFLGRHLGFHVASAPSRPKQRMVDGRLVRSTSGLAILSRWPIVEEMRLTLLSHPADGERNALFVALMSPMGLVRVATVHLTHLRDATALRRSQLKTILNTSWFTKAADVRVVGGDFNARWQEIDAILTSSRWDACDAYRGGDGPEPRATLSHRNANSRSTGEHCIDFLISLAPTKEEHPAFDSARVFGDVPVDGVFPSDHFGVAVTALPRTGIRSKGEAVTTSAP